MNRNYTIENINQVAKEIVKATTNKKLLFYGEMGVGKTTLIKELCKELGIVDVVHSPTFSLVNEYLTKNSEVVYHFDFYRIENEIEAYDMGIEDYFYNDVWSFVEWPENIVNLLPIDATKIHIKIAENGERNIQLKNHL
jgi:tRNA threonylcarbamoyladenosine biosynthesis protein TsaE